MSFYEMLCKGLQHHIGVCFTSFCITTGSRSYNRGFEGNGRQSKLLDAGRKENYKLLADFVKEYLKGEMR